MFTRTYKSETSCRSEVANVIQYNIQLNYIYLQVYAFRVDRPKDAIHSEIIKLEVPYTVQFNTFTYKYAATHIGFNLKSKTCAGYSEFS